MNNASRGYCLSTIRGHIEKQLEQLLQQVTTLRGDIASSRPMHTKGCLLRNNYIQRFARTISRKLPRRKRVIYGILSRHDHSFRPSIGSVRTKAAAR